MSQNKTKVPGQRTTSTNKTASNPTNNISSTHYQPSTSVSVQKSARTHISGMFEQETPKVEIPLNSNEITDNRTVAALLFSVSHNGKPEYFPLYLGRNIIGRSCNADVILEEETVSEEHAIIVIRRINPQSPRLVLSIKDSNSSMGTFINKECIDFDTHVLEDRDIIRFGASYEFALIKLDPEEFHLTKSLDFKYEAVKPKHEVETPHTQIASPPTPAPTLEGIGVNNNVNPYSPSKKNTDKTVIA